MGEVSTTELPPTPASTSIPTATAGSAGILPAIPDLGAVLFGADFSRGWPSIDESTAKIALRNGQYLFEIGPYDGRYFTTNAVRTSNYYAQVEAFPDECPSGGAYGLLFRFVDSGNYYGLILFCNNAYSVTGRTNGALQSSPLLAGMLPADIDAASGTHVLGVLAQNGSFTFYVDGQALGSASDSRHESGDVAMYALSQTADVMRVAFDNLEIRAVP